jgi:hypothetical protein
MTQNLLTDIGEEYMVDQSPDASSHDVGLYHDSTDGLSDTSVVGDITTEPTNTNYARQTSTVTTQQLSGDYGWSNDTLLSFDFSDQTATETVDTAFGVVNFDSSVAGDGGTPTDHLYANPALSQDRDIGSIDTLEIAAGDFQVTVN